MAHPDFKNTLYYGDNLAVLRNPKFFQDESIDLIYLDPPFNSKADYNVLFHETSGEQSQAQIQAFSDFWHWDIQAIKAYDFLSLEGPEDVAKLTDAFHYFPGPSDMLAYLVMMEIRLLELHRVLKPTGSLYLHCDPTASHYLKLILDSIFGPRQFLNEIIWKRSSAHSDTKQGMKRCGRIHDSILLYTKTENYVWNPIYTEYSEDYKNSQYRHVEQGTGRRYRVDNLTAAKPGGDTSYEFKGVKPYKGRYWAYSRAKMEQFDKEGRIVYSKSGMPQYKRYLDEMPGVSLQDIWDDIPPESRSKDLGFPTQKPETLLERIIEASSNEGDIVLDPFCGCGTATIVAEKLHRHWIGIDITFLAINLIKNRIRESFPDADFEVRGEPKDVASARELAKDRYQFQWWALSLVGARPVGSTASSPRVGRKGADEGIDGWLRFPVSESQVERIVVQVKSGHVGVKDIRELRDVVSRQGAVIGLFITLEEPTDEMVREVKATSPYVVPNWNHEYPKIQILTIEQLLHNTRPDIPPTSSMFREAQQIIRQKEVIQKRLG